jgi:hypothetical protein
MHLARFALLVSFPVAVVVFAGCGSPAPSTMPVSSTRAPDAGAAADTSASTSTSTSADGLTLDAFFAALTPAMCDFLDSCKNDEVHVAVGVQMGFLSLLPSLKDPSFSARWEKTTAARETTVAGKKTRRWRATRDEYSAQVPMLLTGYGLTPASLKDIVGKTVRYDAKQAALCLSAIRAPLAACTQAKKVESDASDADLEKMLVAYVAPIRVHLDPCNTVIVGLAEAGQACHEGFECKGAGLFVDGPLRCSTAEGGSGKVCNAQK